LPIARANVGDGSSSGPKLVRMIVHHPGSDARQFSEEINKRLKKDFTRAIDAMFKRLARRLNQ